jgi:predicted NAD-dependent protein-ADP-ribosyltransferase YbiA (DUF1768 family)/alkylated DNA repair dioxygenase AlkB
MNCNPSVEKNKDILKDLLRLDPIKYKNFDRVAEFVLEAPIDEENKSVTLHIMSKIFVALHESNKNWELGRNKNAAKIAEMNDLYTQTALHIAAITRLIQPNKKLTPNSYEALLNIIDDHIENPRSIMLIKDYQKDILDPVARFFSTYNFESEKEKDNIINQLKTKLQTIVNLSTKKSTVEDMFDTFFSTLSKKSDFITIQSQIEIDPRLDTYLLTLSNRQTIEAAKDEDGEFYNVVTGVPVEKSEITSQKKTIRKTSQTLSEERSEDKINFAFHMNDIISGVNFRPFSTMESRQEVIDDINLLVNPDDNIKIYAVKLNSYTDERVNAINKIPGLENKNYETTESQVQSDYLSSTKDGAVITLLREKKSEDQFVIVGEISNPGKPVRNFYVQGLTNFVVLNSDNTTKRLDLTNNDDLLLVQDMAVVNKNGKTVDIDEHDLAMIKAGAFNFKNFKDSVSATVNDSKDVSVDITEEFFKNYSIQKDFKLKQFESLNDALKSNSNIFHEVEIVTLDDKGDVIKQETKKVPFTFVKMNAGDLSYTPVSFLRDGYQYVLHNGEQYDFNEYLKEIGVNQQLLQKVLENHTKYANNTNCIYITFNNKGEAGFRIGKFMNHITNEVLFSKFISDITSDLVEGRTTKFQKYYDNYSFVGKKNKNGEYTINVNFNVNTVGELTIEFYPTKNGYAEYSMINQETKSNYKFPLGKTLTQDIITMMVPTAAEYKELQSNYPFLKDIVLYDEDGVIEYESVPVFINSLYNGNISTTTDVIERCLNGVKEGQKKFNDALTTKIVDKVIDPKNTEKYKEFLKVINDNFGSLENVLFNKFDDSYKMPLVKFGVKSISNVETAVENGNLNVTFNNYGVINSLNRNIQIVSKNDNTTMSSEKEVVKQTKPITNNTAKKSKAPKTSSVIEQEVLEESAINALLGVAEPNKAFGEEIAEEPEDYEDVPFAVLEEGTEMATAQEMKTAHDWFSEKLAGYFELEDLNKLSDILALTKLEGSVLGAVKDRVIYLNNQLQGKGVLYHESFHAVFRYLMDMPQRRELLDSVINNKKHSSKFTEANIEQFASDRNLTLTRDEVIDRIAEEVLADGFQNYMNKNMEPKTLLDKFFELLKKLINFFNKNQKFINNEYEKIRKGDINAEVKNSEMYNNEVAYASIPGLLTNVMDVHSGNIKQKATILESKERSQLINSMVAQMLTAESIREITAIDKDDQFNLRFENARLKLLEDTWNFNKILNSLPAENQALREKFTAKYKNLWTNYSFILGGRMVMDTEGKPLYQIYDLNETNDITKNGKVYKTKNRVNANDDAQDNTYGAVSLEILKNEVRDKYNTVTNFEKLDEDKSDDEIKDMNQLMNLVEAQRNNEQNNFEDEQDDAVKNPYEDLSLAEKGGWESLPKEIREALSVIKFDHIDPEFGIIVPKYVDSYTMFGVILKISSNVEPSEVVENIKFYADKLRDDNVHIVEADSLLAIYNHIKEKCEITEREDGTINIKNKQFYNIFTSTVVRAAVDYILYDVNVKTRELRSEDDFDSMSNAEPIIISDMVSYDVKDKILTQDINQKKNQMLRSLVSTYNKKAGTPEYIKALTSIQEACKTIVNTSYVDKAKDTGAKIERMAKELSDAFQVIGLPLPKSLLRLSLLGISIVEKGESPKMDPRTKTGKFYANDERFVLEGKYLQKDFFTDFLDVTKTLATNVLSGTALAEKINSTESDFKRISIILRAASAYITTYDPTDLPSVFRNAEGKPVYRYLPYTPVLSIAQEITSKGLTYSLKNDNFYDNSEVYYKNNPFFTDMLNNKKTDMSRNMSLFFKNFNVSLFGGVNQQIDDNKKDGKVFKELETSSQYILNFLGFFKRTNHIGKVDGKAANVTTFTRMFTTIESTNTNYLIPGYYDQYFNGTGAVLNKDGEQKHVTMLLTKVKQEYERIRDEYRDAQKLADNFDADKRNTGKKLIKDYNAVLNGDKANTKQKGAVTDNNLRAFNFSFFKEMFDANADLRDALKNAAISGVMFNDLTQTLMSELKEELTNHADAQFNKHLKSLIKHGILKTNLAKPDFYSSPILPKKLKINNQNNDTNINEFYLAYEDVDKNINYKNIAADQFFNYWINSLFLNEVFDGDIALGVKDDTAYNKRQKRNAAASQNLGSGVHKVVYADTILAYQHPEYLAFGPYETIEDINNDPRLIGNDDIKDILVKNFGKKVMVDNIEVDTMQKLFDGQSVSSLMHHIDMYEAIGRMNPKIRELLIKKHYSALTGEELMFLKRNKVVLNSKKTVTASRTLYHKLSEMYIDRNDVSRLIVPEGYTEEEVHEILHAYYSEIYALREINKAYLKENDFSINLSTENEIKILVQKIHKFFEPLPHRVKLHDLLNSMEYHNVDQFMDTESSKLATVLPTSINYKNAEGYMKMERSALYAPNKYKFWQVETSGIKTIVKYSVQSKVLIPANLTDVTEIIKKNGTKLTKAETAVIDNEMNDLLHEYHTSLKDVGLSHEALMHTFFSNNKSTEENVGFMFDLIRKNLATQNVSKNKLKLFETDPVTGKPIHSANLPEIRDMLVYYFFAQYSKFTDEKGTGTKYIHMTSYGSDVLIDRYGNTVFTEDYKNNPGAYEGVTSRPLGINIEERNGKKTYWIECIIPKAVYNNPKQFAKYKKEMLEMFGTRIPTEDKRSMIALKVVDFMDAANMTGIIVPQIVHILAGSDLDIDTLYTQQYSFYKNFNGESILYGDYSSFTSKEQGQFVEYLNFLSKDKDLSTIMSSKIEKQKVSDTFKPAAATLRIMTMLGFENANYNIQKDFTFWKTYAPQDIDIDEINDQIAELENSEYDVAGSNAVIRQLRKRKKIFFENKSKIKYINALLKTDAVVKTLAESKLPVTLTGFNKNPDMNLLVKDKFQNKNLQAKLAILSNSHVFNNLFINERSSTQMFMQILEKFGVSLNDNSYDPFTIDGVVSSRLKNVLSKLGIGVTANINKTLAFFSQYNQANVNNLKESVWRFRTDVDDFNTKNYSNIGGFNNKDMRTIAIIGNILGMFADGAKDPIPAALNLNEINTAITLNMLALGMDTEFVLSLNFMPELKSAINEVQKSQTAVSDGISNQRVYLKQELTNAIKNLEFENPLAEITPVEYANLTENEKLLRQYDESVATSKKMQYKVIQELKNAGLITEKSSHNKMQVQSENLIIKFNVQKLDKEKIEDNTLSLSDLGIQISARVNVDVINTETNESEKGYAEQFISEKAQKMLLLNLYREQSEETAKITRAGNIVNMFKRFRPDFDYLDQMTTDIKVLKNGSSIITDDVTAEIFDDNQIWNVFSRIIDHMNRKSTMFLERSSTLSSVKNTFEYMFKDKANFAKTITSFIALNKFKNTFIQNDPVYSTLSPAVKKIKDAESAMIKDMFKADYWFTNKLQEELDAMQEKYPNNEFLNRLRTLETGNEALGNTEDEQGDFVSFKETVITTVGNAKISGQLLEDVENDADILFIKEPLFFKRLFIHELVRTGLRTKSGSFLQYLNPDFKLGLSHHIDDFVNILKSVSDPKLAVSKIGEYINATTNEEVFSFMESMFANLVYAASDEIDNYKILEPTSDRRNIRINEKNKILQNINFNELKKPEYNVYKELFNHIIPVENTFEFDSDDNIRLKSQEYMAFNFSIPDKSFGDLTAFNMIDIAKSFGFAYEDKVKMFTFPAVIKVKNDYFMLQGVDENAYNSVGKNLLYYQILHPTKEHVTDYNTGEFAVYKRLPGKPDNTSISTVALSLSDIQRYKELTGMAKSERIMYDSYGNIITGKKLAYKTISKELQNRISKNVDALDTNIVYEELDNLRSLHNTGEALYTMRVSAKQAKSVKYGFKGLTDKFNFGNPFTGTNVEGIIPMNGITAAVKAYEDWLDGQNIFVDRHGVEHDLTSEAPRRDWINGEIERLSSLETPTKLGYFKKGYRSHADVLNERINLIRRMSGLATSSGVINIYAGNNQNTHLSNFAIRPFSLDFKDGNQVDFESVEQAFQYIKVAGYGNKSEYANEQLDRILDTVDGAELRKLGNDKKVGLNTTKWDSVSSKIMKQLLKISFENNPDAMEALLDTGDATLTHNEDRSQWKTEFPKLLMEVRDELRGPQSKISVDSNEIQTISEDYGVVKKETNPSKEKTQEFVKLITPQINVQAYKENVGQDANDMFMYGLRWTRKAKATKPLNNKSYANKGLSITNAKAKDGYVYDTVDQNGKPLPPVSVLQPIIAEIENNLGIDMSNYDAVIGNIYLPGQNVATHRDTTESLSARNYPVVVYTIGNNSGITIYENQNNPGSASFASDKQTTIPTKNGSIYTFGMDGKGRFELAHDTPKKIKREQKFPAITLPNGTVVENYTITLTFRRAADLTPGMPEAPAKIGVKSQVETEIKVQPTNDYTNHSGGANGSDTIWDITGKEFGMVNNKHYFTGTRSEMNAPLGNVDITGTPLAVEGASKVAQAAQEMWGYKYATMKDARLIRNWAQVANSDAVFAIGTLGKKGDIWKGDEKSAEPRRLLKESVQGGTGYAVEMAIQAGKPVYVFDQVRKQWYKNIAGVWSKSDVPVLTKNFAGIGTREINEDGKQAIRDVYENTFSKSATTQPSISVKREYTPENITSLKENEVFVFGSNIEGRHGKGAALTAKNKFGAKYGQAEGLQGQSYAIITKDLNKGERSISLDRIHEQLSEFVGYAEKNPNITFYVTKLGSSLAGYTELEIKKLFKDINNEEIIPNNVILPKEYEVRNESRGTQQTQTATTEELFTTKVNQFQYTYNPQTGEVIHNAKAGNKIETNETQIGKVLANYVKENNLPVETFNKQQYSKVGDKVVNVNTGSIVTQKQILDLFKTESVKTPKKEVDFGKKQLDLFTESETQVEDEFTDLDYYDSGFSVMSEDEEDGDDLPEMPDTGDSATEEQC